MRKLNYNELLKRENIDMLHTIADLNNKLNALENEKASLLTITRLLQSELAENNTNYSPSTVQNVSYSKSNNKYCDVATKISKDLSKVKGASTTNKFSVLDSEEIHDDKDSIVISTSSDCSVYESKRTERKKPKPVRQSTQTSSQNQRKQHSNEKNTQTESGPSSQSHKSRNKRNIEICGNSMTKHLQAYRIGRSTNERVSSKSFSGATCKGMKHYIVPTLEKKPDELILHIGTNDLKDRAPKEVVRDIMALKDFIVKKSPQTKVTILELTLRTDDKKINDKV